MTRRGTFKDKASTLMQPDQLHAAAEKAKSLLNEDFQQIVVVLRGTASDHEIFVRQRKDDGTFTDVPFETGTQHEPSSDDTARGGDAADQD